LDLFVPLASALLIGSAHAFEPDHVAAVTSFTARRPHTRAALGFGTHWAIGHGAVVVAAGATLLLAGLVLPLGANHMLERCVGLSLIALGAWTLSGRRGLSTRPHTHRDATHAHPHTQPHAAGNSTAAAIGALHGLAGTAPVLALVPLAGIESTRLAIVFLLLFALGTAAGMTLFAVVTGWLAHRAAGRSLRFARLLSVGSGAATIGIGLLWLVR
jgi:nickel/cobalt transporter (NicO) family protein